MQRLFHRHALRFASLFLFAISISGPQFVSARAQNTAADEEFFTAPQYIRESWSVRDGLPVNSITAMVQSRDGYLWMTTFDGLVRFDGVGFTVFNSGNTPTLTTNRLIDLAEADDETLWIRTIHNRLVQYKDGVFIDHSSEGALGAEFAYVFSADEHGALWIGLDNGVAQYSHGTLTRIGADEFAGVVATIQHTRDGKTWLGTKGDGIVVVSDQGIDHFTELHGLSSGDILDIASSPQGDVFIATLIDFDVIRGGEIAPLLPSAERLPDRRRGVYHGSDSVLYLSTEPNVFRYAGGALDLFGNQLESEGYELRGWEESDPSVRWLMTRNHLYRNGEVVFRASDGLRSFLIDRERTIWIATRSQGLHRLRDAVFQAYSEPEGLSHKNAYGIAEDRDGSIWIATMGGGINRFDPAAGVFATLSPDLQRGHATTVSVDPDGTVWLGINVGVCRWRDGRCEVFGAGTGLHQAAVQAVLRDRDGNTWIGTMAGLFRFRDDVLVHRYSTRDVLMHDNIRNILELRDGTLLFASEGGGVMMYESGRFAPLEGLSSLFVRALHEDNHGIIWIGTEDRGLNRVERTEDGFSISVIRQEDGLFDEGIHQILQDDFDRFWMSTNRGIFWVERSALTSYLQGASPRIRTTAYDERDGMRNREANGGTQHAGMKARDGRLWFPTQDGVVVVDPSRIALNPVPPPVVVEQVLRARRPVPITDGSVSLARGSRNFEIQYNGLSLLSSDRIEFRYRLVDFENEWVEAGNRRTAYYTNVPPGRYTFHVTAANSDGVWNETGASLAVVLEPHFYESTWFYFLCAFGVLAAAVAGYRYRIGRLKRREAELSALVSERTAQIAEHRALLKQQNERLAAQAAELTELDRAKSSFFANVSHEFRTPLTLTIGPLEDLREAPRENLSADGRRQVEMALRNARRMLRLINQLLDLSKLETGFLKLNRASTDVAALIRNVTIAFTPLAERRRIELVVSTEPGLPPAFIDSDQIEKVLINLISNAFKSTPDGGKIGVTARTAAPTDEGDTAFEMTVSDTGSGIPENQIDRIFERFYQIDESRNNPQPGTGIGLSLVKELVTLHGGRVHVESQEGFGATFTVTLPVGSEQQDAPDSDIAVSFRRAEGDGNVAHELPDLTAELVSDPVQIHSENNGDHSESRPTILVVDDNADIRSYIRNHLEPVYAVAEAENGKEALGLARSQMPDLVISDVMMPEMDGFELCRSMKRDPGLYFIPVILLTAKASSDGKLTGLDEGADDYLTKPFNMGELTARIRNLISLRQRLRRRLEQVRPELHPDPVATVSADDRLLQRVKHEIELRLSDTDFSVETLATEVGMSRVHLYRRLRELTGHSPAELILSMRTERAAQLITAEAGTISEIAYGVGFKSVSHFCKCFRERYDVTPTQFAARDSVEK